MAIKLFIGTSPNGLDQEIEAIYEYSLLANTSEELDIVWMKATNDKTSYWNGWADFQWFTPFSGFRWAIPEICNFKGRAIYTDVDMINFHDISKLSKVDLQGKPFGARKGNRWGYELCVMVIDCELAKKYIWNLKKLKKKKDAHAYHRDMIIKKKLITPIDPRWNCLDGEDLEIPEMYQLHFTNMPSQPWHPEWYPGEKEKHSRDDILRLYESLKAEVSKKNFFSSCKFDPDDVIDLNIRL
jgi:lipopolysaccharide biosynthesis glycosyltransferase